MTRSMKALLLAATGAGLMAGSAPLPPDRFPTLGSGPAGLDPVARPGSAPAVQGTPLPRHACKGQNACKGQGGCSSGDMGCKGKNTCKGRGGCNTLG